MCCPFHRWQSAREDAFLIYVVKNNFASLCRLCNTERTCRRSASQSTEYHSKVHEGSIRGEKALFTLLFLHFQQVFRDSNQQFNSHLSRFSRVCSPSRRIFFIFFYTILTSASFSLVLSFVKSVQTSEPTLSHQTLFWLCHSFLFCPFFSKSIMHQCGIADLGLKQTLLLSFHGWIDVAFANAEQTVQGQRERHSQYSQVFPLWNIRIYSNSLAWSRGLRMF